MQLNYERKLFMKKFITLIIAVFLISSVAISVSAAAENINVYLEGFSGSDGEKINFDVPPQTVNNRTMVPIRAIFEAMGATVDWDDSTQTATCVKENTTVKMTLNSTTEYINGVPHSMDVSPVIINGRTLAPARYVAEAFGYNVSWDEMTQSVLISKNQKYNISNVVDGSRNHPYKLGSTVSFKFFDRWLRGESGVCSLTIDSLLSPEDIKKQCTNRYFFDENDWLLKGHIKLLEYTGSDSCDDFSMLSSNVVTSKFKKLDSYSWYSSISPLNYNIDLYPGGETDCYIKIDTKELTDGETADYFTVTYEYGTEYNAEKTIWFSLK